MPIAAGTIISSLSLLLLSMMAWFLLELWRGNKDTRELLLKIFQELKDEMNEIKLEEQKLRDKQEMLAKQCDWRHSRSRRDAA